jgi:hypothetical protein
MLLKMLLGLVALTVLVPAAYAQTMGTCAKPDFSKDIPAGDREGHLFAIAQGKCKRHVETNGVSSDAATFSEHAEITPTLYKAWGIFVETYANGDKISYSYILRLPIKDGVQQPGTSTYRATSGTGKMKGIKSSGECKFIPHPDTSADFTCTTK